jgi:methylthioribulose-1-phosphate dehydratase
MTPFDNMSAVPQDEIKALQDIGALFYGRGWSLGTSSNYSVVLCRDPLRLLMTASGKDKRSLRESDFVVVDVNGQMVTHAGGKASAETLLHVVAAQQAGVGAVLHTHSIWATILSDFFAWDAGLEIEGYEMLKGLAGVTTHDHSIWLNILDNSQDMPDLARRVQQLIVDQKDPLRHAFLLRRHGMYTWGRDLEEARKHVEILEFLLEVTGRSLSLGKPAPAAIAEKDVPTDLKAALTE